MMTDKPQPSSPDETAPIAVVLLNYDGGAALGLCISSLREQEVLPQRLMFVDNGSSEYDEAALRFSFGPRYHGVLSFERLEKNVGYASGMNHGLARVLSDADGPPWVMTLSNDTELDPAFFRHLRDELALPDTSDMDDAVGMLAPKIRSMDNRELLDGAGIGVSLDGMSTARGQRERDSGQYDSGEGVHIPNGVAAIYHVKMLREIGLLDESFFAYCEDTDLGLRAWLAGWECCFLPDCVVYHARSSTLGEHGLEKLYLVERNHYWVALKNLPWPLLALNPPLSAYRYLVQLYAVASRRGQGQGYGERYSAGVLAATTLRAVMHAGFGAPAMLKKRAQAKSLMRRGLLETLIALWSDRLPFDKLILK